jgi:hypothetical protein
MKTQVPFVQNQTPAGFSDLPTGDVALAGQLGGALRLVSATTL